MAVLLVQLQAPDTGLYSIPWTDCTEKPSESRSKGKWGEGLKGHRSQRYRVTKDKLFPFFKTWNKIKETHVSVHKYKRP